jgi:hypothetical protein
MNIREPNILKFPWRYSLELKVFCHEVRENQDWKTPFKTSKRKKSLDKLSSFASPFDF